MIPLHDMLLWGFIATCTMACLQEGTQALGLSRMSFPFIMGTIFTGRRGPAQIIGFLLYIAGGCVFTLIYCHIFSVLKFHTVWAGLVLGLFQGLVMLLVFLPLLPYFHPRMSSPYDGPTDQRQIEPPGFMALHYGARAPLIHLIGQMAFGAIIGAAYARY